VRLTDKAALLTPFEHGGAQNGTATVEARMERRADRSLSKSMVI